MKNQIVLFLLVISFQWASAQSRYGYTNGSSIMLRSNHSTTAPKIKTLKKDEELEILDEYYPTNNTNEAILKYETRFYSNYDGQFVFKLPQGKAVKVLEHLNDGKVRISYAQHGGSSGYATITVDRLQFINGDAWYKVRTADGKVGWVFGQFVEFEIGD